MNLDLNVISRSGYTVVDIFSDVGGLQGILISGIVFFLNIWNHNYLDNHLVSQLFRAKARSQGLKTFPVSLSNSTSGNIRDFCLDRIIPTKLACCRKSRKLEAIKKAREKLEGEIDIIKMIKSRRFVHMALKKLLDP